MCSFHLAALASTTDPIYSPLATEKKTRLFNHAPGATRPGPVRDFGLVVRAWANIPLLRPTKTHTDTSKVINVSASCTLLDNQTWHTLLNDRTKECQRRNYYCVCVK